MAHGHAFCLIIIWKDLYLLSLCLMLQCSQHQSRVMSVCVCSVGKHGVWRISTSAELWAKASLEVCIWPGNVRPSSSWHSRFCSKSSWRKLEWSTSCGGRWRYSHISGRGSHHLPVFITPGAGCVNCLD